VAVASLGSGAFVGWLVGKEKDELHALRYRGGRALRPDAVSITMSGEPTNLTVSDSIVAAYGVGGVQLVTADSRPKLIGVRAPGLLGVSDAALVTSQAQFALTASGGLYRFPIGPGQGVRLRPPPAAAVTANAGEYFIGSGVRIERVNAASTTESATWPGLALDDSVRAIRTDPRGVVWAVTSGSLYALRTEADSFSVVSRTGLPVGARKVDVQGNLAAVALGDSGIRFFDVAEPAQPKHLTDWRGTPFAYDVALNDSKAYVAAGIDGMAVLTLDGSTARLDGLARELGFIVSVAARAPFVWVLDRSGSAVVRRVPMNDIK
jgi:hypothetical protein